MSPRKLTAADKKEIVKVYRSSAESTAALAARYGVSSSTVSRLLKSHIPEVEYETLMSEKRGQKIELDEEEIFQDEPTAVVTELAPTELELPNPSDRPVTIPKTAQSKPVKKSDPTDLRRVRRRSSALSEQEELEQSPPPELPPKPVIKAVKTPFVSPVNPVIPAAEIAEIVETIPVPVVLPPLVSDRLEEEDDREDVLALASILGEEMGDLLDEEEEDFNDDEDWAYGLTPSVLASDIQIQVLPLSAANLPRTCYIVIDKFAELVAKPLREFAELGNIPADEVPQQTLPIFDNHRIAKRFSSSHTNRVIKVPDSGLFQKTSRHLEAKGITRLLVDGQIYSLN
jgi:transposase-like protein